MRLSVVILAGGRSRRMGRDKAALPAWGHRTLLDRQLALAAAQHPIERLVSCRPEQRLDLPRDVRRIHDDGSAGPIGGVAAALDAMRGDALLVIGIDLPALQPALLRRIVGAAAFDGTHGVIPRGPDGPEPMAALLPRRAVQLANERAASERQRSMRAFSEALVDTGLARWFELAATDLPVLANWNRRGEHVTAQRVRP